MGRKAKAAAQQKIGEWTGARRSVSKPVKTTTKSKNTNASNEIRNPLQTHSPSDMNAMKNCKVLLEKLPAESKPAKPAIGKKSPAKKIPIDDITEKDKQADAQNVYDYSFDIDESGPTQNENEMKDIFDKLVKENKIEVKRYRPKNGKKKKPDENGTDKKAQTQKRRREKQPVDVEPPRKKPNLKNKVINVDSEKNVALKEIPKRNIDAENNNNNLQAKKLVIIEQKESVATKTADGLNQLKPVDTLNTENENVNAQRRLRNRNLGNLQSTPKTSTPLGQKAAAKGKVNNRSLNSLFFENASPLVTGSARLNVQRQRLQLSAIDDSQEDVPSTSAGQNIENENLPQPNYDYDDDDDFDFGNDAVNEPQPALGVGKENSLDRPSTSTAALTSLERPKDTSLVLSERNRPGTSSSTSSWNQPSTSAASRTPPRNDKSIFEIQNTSDYNIFSPTKRRVYGRSPLKNITSEVNNTNSPSFNSMKSVTTMPRSFGVLIKSMQTTNTTKDTELTLPEASYFSSRRVAHDFDRHVENQNIGDDCFGFDTVDDDITDESIEKTPEKTAKNDSKSKACGLEDIRAKLKRFLHNYEAEPNESMKKTKVTSTTMKTTPMKLSTEATKSPMKSLAKTVKTPAKQKRNVVFGDTGAKQKDIRSVFTAKSNDKPDSSKDNPVANLFGEVETVQDRRRSYSRPQRQRKRRISIDSEQSEEEQHSDDGEEYDEHGKPSKRVKRRKKTAQPNPKELEELEEFARLTNEHFNEVDSFVLAVE